ncbi:MAG: hypothetical protein A3F53_01695 [Candidatus Zambryskibacteria bacterium RIFCSPHIGHO2_12_FULL_48_10]|uniref:Uncharacterized protein n=1 Tax=Candidatus Zambryskibacteria bacterium RIFCSPHIGHO2_01_FULL_46_25 TaxID=1802738 RepID=A0A1G2T0C2_9BACT|nr:MAG: hypothetical protein UX71_C0002G0226 [Parcubacteria group bacterium GW2011_GWA1_47_10]OHA90061.1 MAG: hypothetical protein A2838_00275 [Candidatus Zambryskibacteria bacterium RIFCSPHIGHO2_01_FULL_46_25]OHB02658.1 MAG: hypothetical protein A3F53_01695 [Candidatus Zambryskibacteria bacterium RIFCSPHIGHO2_12_FULL_48_10]OHB06564.1 MAG: hypothetical protein A3A31_02980 [Candidatus Zambryskibacteria bacterium RIFCSPLOWO2_01_FULL_48_25]
MKTALLSVLLSFAMLFPVSYAKAQIMPFGGLSTFFVPCTCSGNLAIWFAPFFLGGPAIATGFITYSPYATFQYSDYMAGMPDVWYLGSYIPGVQACYIYVGVTCTLFPTIGLMTQVGTGLPGI